VNKELEGHDNPSLNKSGEPSNRRNVQGEALQINDNTAGGKKLLLHSCPMLPSLIRTRVKVRLFKLMITAPENRVSAGERSGPRAVKPGPSRRSQPNSPLPLFVRPQLSQPVEKPPSGPQ
jgi:hypothetical protein